MLQRSDWFCLLGVMLVLSGCTPSPGKRDSLFSKVPSTTTHIDFINQLTFNQQFNIYTYRNFYNGAGVGLGDFNNDGLLDIYFTANQGQNKLYLNKGNFEFEDITNRAGVGGSKAWSTGVSIADVNGDGWLDIYVCNSGDVEGDDKENELFINNGDLTFTERAQEYGLDDQGFTTHAVFFDYDRDGDLDLYILNNSYQAIGSFNLMKNIRSERDSLGGDKLMRNDGNLFTDVSEKAGIYGSVIGFGLGATVGDINRDGWPDIYVSNDFFERDYLYINNHDGTFKECLTEQMKSISGASMGADLADINNDGWPDIFVTEMLPETNSRIKTVTTFENWDRYQYGVSNGYYHQFTRNMLQLNNGNGTFSEIGRLAGVEATDWSWGALIFDMDNDGLKDIFVANGIYKDLTNQDYLQYISNEEVVRSIVSNNQVNYARLVELIPSNPIPDYTFRNSGQLQFEDVSKSWGISEANFSNGSAYGDLDNDGDLDLVVSHVNSMPSVYRNRSESINPANRFLKFSLRGDSLNRFAVGARIEVVKGDTLFTIEQIPNRGFESSVDPRPNLGLGQLDTVDRVTVYWPDSRYTSLTNVATNQTLILSQSESTGSLKPEQEPLSGYFQLVQSPLDWAHVENEFVDFDRDKLIYHMLSTEGPRASVGDVNNDGLEDIFVTGAKDTMGKLFLQNAAGQFISPAVNPFEEDRAAEDTGSLFFDADQDGDLDLYVCSGGSEFSNISNALADRLYFNDGLGNFTKSAQQLPTTALENTSVVKSTDFDGDGDLDLFVGIRSQAFAYGYPMNGYILENNGHGEFSNVTANVAPELLSIGMITDAVWTDLDKDGDMDLVVVGDFMPVRIFYNNNGAFTSGPDLDHLRGWWNRIEASDLDSDGDIDLVLANHGLNSRFHATHDKPITLFVNDFDRNGTVEQIVCTYFGEKSYPFALRHDLIAQIPSLKKKYLKYENYADQTMSDIFTKEELSGMRESKAYELATGILENKSNGNFEFRRLPMEAQFSVMKTIYIEDFTQDGFQDILLAGNLYGVKPEAGRYDASYGVLLKGDGKGNFISMPAKESGILMQGEVRDIRQINVRGKNYLIVLRNNDTPQFFEFIQTTP